MGEGSASRTHGYLDDHHGNASSMRLMSMVALLASIAFGVLGRSLSRRGESQRALHHDGVPGRGVRPESAPEVRRGAVSAASRIGAP